MRSDAGLVFPSGFSFFEPYLVRYVREVLEIGGEAVVTRSSDGAITGLFLYDDFERGGTIFTRSREVFDYFYNLKQFDYLFAEMWTEHRSETYDIYTADLRDTSRVPKFSHEITMGGHGDASEIERFVVSTHPRTNSRWVDVALRNGDKCFMVRLQDEVAGLGWVSLVNGVGRLHSLYVKPQFRRIGIGEDILFARLLWLRLKRARSVFSEISRSNIHSSRIAAKAQMRASGQIFQYFKKDPDRGKDELEGMVDAPSF